MSSCDESNIKKNYIVQTPTDFDILSACTGFYTNNIYNCTGDTLTLHSTTVSANTINASVYLSGGTNLLDIFGSLDNYTTGATLVGTEVVFDRTNLLSAYTLNLSTLVDNNTFVTGYTYDGANTFTISDNSGSTFNATFNTVTGLTVTGGLSATTLSACTGIYTSNLYGCSPITVNDSLILLSGLTFSSITQDNSLTQILSRDSSDGTIKYRDVSSIAPAAKLQNTYFVSSLSGNNSTSLVGDVNNPWKTITEARNQAVADGFSNSLIHVYSGEYLEDEIQYENGNFYFEPNANVTTQRTDATITAIFKLGKALTNVSNLYSATTCNVYGYGNFTITATTDSGSIGGVVVDMDGDSKLYFEFDEVNNYAGNSFNLQGNSDIHINGNVLGFYEGISVGRDGFDVYGNSNILANIDKVIKIQSNPDDWIFRHRPGYNGKTVINFNTLSSPYQIFAWDTTTEISEITYNFTSVEHTGGSPFVVNSGNSKGKVNFNGNIYAPYGNGFLLFHDDGELNINGNIICRDTAILAIDFSSPSNNFVLNYNGDIVTSGVTSDPPPLNSNGGIELNKITANLNGSLTNLSLGSLSNGINIDGDSILSIDNFDINVVSGNTIGTSSSNVVNINHSLSINKPMSSGITTTGLFNFTGTTNVGGLVIYNTPTNDDSLTQILGRNSTNGDIEYRDVSSIIGAASADTFVTGFTYNNANTFTISDNSGSTFNSTINTVTGLTVNGTFIGNNGSNVFEMFSDQQKITLVDSSFAEYRFEGGELLILGPLGDIMKIGVTSGNEYIKFDADTSTLQGSSGTNNTWTLPNATGTIALTSDITDTFVSGGTYNSSSKEINFTGNSAQTTFGVDLTTLFSAVSGDTFIVSGNADAGNSELTFTYNTGGTITVTNSAALFSDNDINVTGGTYNPSNGCVTFGTNSGTTFDVCGFVTGITDTYTTGSTLVGETIQFDNNILGLNYYNVSLSPVLSGKTNNSTFNTYTSDTQTILDSKVQDGINVGSGTGEIFSGKSGTTLNFRTLSGGTNTTVTTIGDVNRIDVSIPLDNNTFVSGGTYNDSTDIITFTNTTGGTFNVTGITDTFVTGGTLSSGTLRLERQNGVVDITGFTTGSSYTSWFATGDNQTPSVPIDVVDTFNLKFTGFISSGGAGIATDSAISANEMTIALINNGGSPTDNTFYRGDGQWQSPTNTFVTGFTYDNINTFTISDNSGSTFNSSINVLSATTISATTYYGDGSNLTGISTDDNYVTGGTYNSGTLTLDRQNGSVTVTGFTTDTNTTVTGFTYNDANTFTISDSDGSTFDASIDIMTGLTVNGQSTFSGSSTDVVQIYGSGSTSPIFRIQGSSGELFSVTDSLVGELFAVNDISGLPILRVNSDDTILWGDNTVPSLNTTVKKSINSGLSEIYSIPVSAYTGGFFDYTITGAGARAGSIMSIFSGTSVQFNETTTNDIGDTSGITFDMNISGGTANLTVSATTSSWEIRTIVRTI